jgi:hypothetical protein
MWRLVERDEEIQTSLFLWHAFSFGLFSVTSPALLSLSYCKKTWGLFCFARATKEKYHRPGSLNNKHLFFHQSRG